MHNKPVIVMDDVGEKNNTVGDIKQVRNTVDMFGTANDLSFVALFFF